MNIIKALLYALGAFVALIVIGMFVGGFLAPGVAYALGQMAAPVDIVLAIVVFFYAKRRLGRKKSDKEA